MGFTVPSARQSGSLDSRLITPGKAPGEWDERLTDVEGV